MRGANVFLIALGSFLLALYFVARFLIKDSASIVWIIALTLGQAIVYLVAVWIAGRAQSARSTLIITLVFAALFRLSFLFMPPALSSDIFRYIWDGRVQAAGINPYRHIPSEEPLAHLRDEAIYPNMNRINYARTIYPPVAQMIFFVATRVSESVTGMKAAMVGFEVVTIAALASLLASFGQARHRVLIYAWHPLTVWEIAGSGHVDAAVMAMVALALLARRRHLETATGVALACATLIKLIPVALFPALYRKWGWKMIVAFAATIIIAYLPYLSVGARVLGYLPGYASEEGIEGGQRFYLLALARRALPGLNAPTVVYLTFAMAVLAAIAARALFKRETDERDFITRAAVIATAFMLLLTPRYAWYYVWLVPFLCFVTEAPLLYLTSASFILYGLWLADGADNVFMLNSLLWLPCALLGLGALWKQFARGRETLRQAL
jgi:alpha-1,6-mannosyltransferase